jgi:ATP-dependent Clp protease ATP-binding subunit ClpA
LCQALGVFERFTEPAREVVVLAQDEARALKHDYIGTEHLLLGLLREEEGVAARALENLDVTVEEARAEVARVIGEGDKSPAGQIPFTPRAKKVLELALREALALRHGYIGTEHILLGLARENEGVATRILLGFDADAETIRNEVLRLVEGSGGGGASHPRRRRRRWEYRVESLAGGDQVTAELLDALGAEGWELVAIVGEAPDARLVLKRPV